MTPDPFLIGEMIMHPLPHLENNNKTVRIEWVDLGEGKDGDYDSTDPNDIPYLRFDVYKWNYFSHDWDTPDSSSYCTRVPRGTDTKTLSELLHVIMEQCEGAVLAGTHKKILERLSWIDEHGRFE
jgi:hypothetical protein